MQRAASVVESTVNRLFLQIDGTLASLPDLVGQVARNQASDAEAVSRILRSINFQNLNFRDLLLVQPDGIAWASAQVSSRDRPLPVGLREIGPAVRSGAVSIAGPVQNPTTGEWALFFVRPVRLPHLGMLYAAAEVPIPLMVTLLNPAAEVPGLRVAVTRTDGRLLVGLPHDEARLSRQSAGAADSDVATAATPAAMITAARPTLYRTIAIAVTLDAAIGVTEWRRDRDRLVGVALGASVVVVALALAALLVVQQRERGEEERRRARATLESAIDSMSDGFVMFDAEDRLVVCNKRYREMYGLSAPFIVPGASFEHIIREGAQHGQYPQAGEDIEGFTRETVAWHRGDHPPMERMLPNGRWLLITERPMPDGGTVGIRTDITAQKQAMRELAIGERRYSALAKAGAIVTWQASADGTILEAPGWAALTGLPDAALRDGRWLSVIHPEDQAMVLPNWVAAADADGSVDIEFRILTGAGWRWMRVRGAPVYEPPRTEPLEWVGTIHDVHDRRAAQAALAESEARFVRAISAVGMGTWDWNLATDVLHLSPGYEALYQKEEGTLPTARAAADATHPDDVATVTAAVDRALKGSEGDSYDIEFRIVQPGGGLRWLRMQGRAERDAEGRAVRMSGVTQDVTAKHDAELQLAHMARHDPLTDLPNRTLLRERMDAAMADAKRGDASAIFCLDLDRFKQVNDTLGHPIGDALLRAVTDRLLGCIRKTDMVARIGGDGSAIVQSSVNQPSDARALARRIIAAISKPYEIEGNRIVIGTSLGIAIAPQDGVDSDRLLRSADLALYRAKTDGRGTFRFFEPEMNIRMQARHALETDLRRALVQREFEVFYQPLIDIRTRQVCSFEALLRWRHPERGLVAPDSFIPAAEELGLIGQIGEVVLARACAEATHWPAGIRVAVNLSPAQFADPGMMGMVMGALHRSGLPAERLELEITETLLLQESEDVLATLHELQRVGVTISMDDFGTGYSSLSYLRKFPFRKVKIDKSFIRELGNDPGSGAIVQAVLDLCRTLGIKTTAEGVETEQQLAWLDAAGCAEAQGYLFSAARPAAEIPLLLRLLNEAPVAAGA
ncbi:EAL domain-containing protein [Dankookia sp. P2]|uniref:EAL domain-containing protein n=1 Tax=Dankookia sp. P2 TaxID=3423955 RepID=UPI003D663C05